MTDVETVPCASEGCLRGIKNHYWAKVQGQSDGWFLQKDGTAWCPEHNPDWVAEWRAKKAAS